jgi:hypothetical protein
VSGSEHGTFWRAWTFVGPGAWDRVPRPKKSQRIASRDGPPCPAMSERNVLTPLSLRAAKEITRIAHVAQTGDPSLRSSTGRIS